MGTAHTVETAEPSKFENHWNFAFPGFEAGKCFLFFLGFDRQSTDLSIDFRERDRGGGIIRCMLVMLGLNHGVGGIGMHSVFY